jgi:thiamine-phosphate pyrophosphorylase
MVCYVTNRMSLGAVDPIAELLGRIRVAVRAGADWVQIREKDLQGRELLELARNAVAAANERPAAKGVSKPRVYVNDRLDVALAAGAAGVHLGGESAPAGDVVRWCRNGNVPSGFEIGVSCHSVEDAREAARAGAGYIFFGPVFDTPSKREFGAPQGAKRLAEVCGGVRIPVIAIGGVNEENAPASIRAGAAGIAAIRMFQETQSPVALSESIARLHALGATR